MPKSELTKQEKIAMCAVMVLGTGYMAEAFAMCHPKVRTDNEASLKVMQSRWFNSDRAKAFQKDVLGTITGKAVSEGNDLRTREGIISSLIESTAQTSGKERISGLQTLAKIQGFDKEVEKPEEERRHFYLPYVSKCRYCKLMEVYMELRDETGNNKPCGVVRHKLP